jgi:hypothetical protein
MLPIPSAVCVVDVRTFLPAVLYDEVVTYFAHRTDAPRTRVERQVVECLRYLYLISRYPTQLGGLFLPVEQEIDEIWHYLILQTRQYRVLCEESLPGGFFIEHRSVAFSSYQQEPGREKLIDEALRWLPLYRNTFGPFDDDGLPHWTMARFLKEQLGLSLADIAALEADVQA